LRRIELVKKSADHRNTVNNRRHAPAFRAAVSGVRHATRQ